MRNVAGQVGLKEVRDAFGGVVPRIFAAMAERQVLAAVWPLVKDALFDDDAIGDRRVREGLMVALSTRCSNRYCFVAHSFFLYGLGFALPSIVALVENLTFPEEVNEHERWSHVLQWAFLNGGRIGELSTVSDESIALLDDLVSEEEKRHLFKICATISLLGSFSEFYSEQVRIDDDEMLLDGDAELLVPIPDLAKYYDERQQRRPIVAVCMYCKRIRDSKGNWHALENVLSALERDAAFTHTICPPCVAKQEKRSG